MRTFFILLTIALSFQFIAAGNLYGQTLKEANINYRTKSTSINNVFNQLSKLTGYNFFYEESVIKDVKPVSIQTSNASLDHVLGEITRQTGLRFQKTDNTISVSRPQPVVEAISNVALQAKKVTGSVVDETGEPIIGASIVEKGTTNGISTDIDGMFTISVAPDAMLQISYIGYIPQEISVSGKNTIQVLLREDTQMLEEVVVVAYGTQKKKDLTGAITAVDSKLITTQSTSTVTKALEGAVAGLQVSTVDGQPGMDMAIRVRGLGSTNIGSSSALIVIDGVPQIADGITQPLSTMNPSDIASVTVLKDAASTALYGSRGANGVVMITTNKGQSGKPKVSASARWGVNSIGPFNMGKIDNAADYYEYAWKSIYNSYRYGVNGSGLPQGFTSNVNNPNYTHEQAAEFASQHLFNYMNSESKFGRNMLGNFMAYRVPGAVYTPDGTGGTHSATMTGAYLVGTDGRINPSAQLLYDDNYGDYLVEDNFRQDYNISLSGGKDKINYYVSLGYLEDPAYIKASKYSRYSGRSNIDVTPLKWLKFGANVAYSHAETERMAVKWSTRNPGSNQGNVFRFINGHSPIVPVYAYNEDGSYCYHSITGTPYYSTEGGTYSPLGSTMANYGGTDILYNIANDTFNDLSEVMNMRLFGEVSFLTDFKFTFNFSYDKSDVTRTQYSNSKSGFGKGVGGMAKTINKWNVMNIQEVLSYNKDLDKHHIDAMVAHEYNDWDFESTRFGAGYELLPGFISSSNFVGKYTNVSGLPTPGYDKEIERMESYLGRLNYIYDEKYYLSASIRGDGSSKFKNERWGAFWSVGAGWRFSEESFMQSTKSWLNNAKLRASYGVIGNANSIGRYSGYRTWTFGTKYTESSAGTGIPNGIYTLSPGGFVNDALTWENTNTFDVGIDMHLLNRFSVTFDYYNRFTENSFFNQPVSYMATGQETLQLNGAGIRNQGVEIELGATILSTKDFTWNVSLNGTHYTTILEKIPAGAISDTPGLPSGTWLANGEGWTQAGSGDVSNGQYYLRGEGRPWYNLYMYKYAGPDQETGLPTYWHNVSESEAGKGDYANNKAGDDVKVLDYNQASKYEVGDAVPDFIGGFTTNLRYRDFDLSAVLAYQLGGKYYSVEYGNGMYRSGAGLAATTYVLSDDLIGNTWTPENRDAKYPMQWYGGSSEYYDGSTFGSWKYTDMALFSASYMRVKNITLGYTLPKTLLSKLHMSNLRLYASADNLFMFSAAKGIDPSKSLTGGMEVGGYTFPAMRTISFGINLDF